MPKIIHYLMMGLLLIGCNSNPGKTPEERINYVVNQAFERGDFIGSVLVANKGEVIYHKNLGMADAKRGIPIGDSTKFLLASVSKPITAILILQLVDQGKIELGDPLGNFFSIGNNTQASKVTVHQLLTHTSGIEELISEDHAFEGADLEQASFSFEPGSDFEYSSTGYVILKEIAERSSGKGFENLIEQICKLAQMNSSGVTKDVHQSSDMAIGYKATDQAELVEIGYPLKIVDGAGSLYATANDLFKLDRALYTEKLFVHI
ncbi:MAG: serine hydrolase domain-containing protein [Bacteroidota bacterium]